MGGSGEILGSFYQINHKYEFTGIICNEGLPCGEDGATAQIRKEQAIANAQVKQTLAEVTCGAPLPTANPPQGTIDQPVTINIATTSANKNFKIKVTRRALTQSIFTECFRAETDLSPITRNCTQLEVGKKYAIRAVAISSETLLPVTEPIVQTVDLSNVVENVVFDITLPQNGCAAIPPPTWYNTSFEREAVDSTSDLITLRWSHDGYTPVNNSTPGTYTYTVVLFDRHIGEEILREDISRGYPYKPYPYHTVIDNSKKYGVFVFAKLSANSCGSISPALQGAIYPRVIVPTPTVTPAGGASVTPGGSTPTPTPTVPTTDVPAAFAIDVVKPNTGSDLFSGNTQLVEWNLKQTAGDASQFEGHTFETVLWVSYHTSINPTGDSLFFGQGDTGNITPSSLSSQDGYPNKYADWKVPSLPPLVAADAVPGSFKIRIMIIPPEGYTGELQDGQYVASDFSDPFFDIIDTGTPPPTPTPTGTIAPTQTPTSTPTATSTPSANAPNNAVGAIPCVVNGGACLRDNVYPDALQDPNRVGNENECTGQPNHHFVNSPPVTDGCDEPNREYCCMPETAVVRMAAVPFCEGKEEGFYTDTAGACVFCAGRLVVPFPSGSPTWGSASAQSAKCDVTQWCADKTQGWYFENKEDNRCYYCWGAIKGESYGYIDACPQEKIEIQQLAGSEETGNNIFIVIIQKARTATSEIAKAIRNFLKLEGRTPGQLFFFFREPWKP